MRIKPWAEFTSDLPDDHIENEAGTDILQFGGKSVIAAIGEMLQRLGCEAGPPIYAYELVWELNATVGGRRLWCQVTLIEGYVMGLLDRSRFAGLFGRHHPVYLDILGGLSEQLARDPRFHDVSWFTSDEVTSGIDGAGSPVGE